MAGAVVAVAAQVALAGRLPGEAKLGGDLRPADAEAHRVVDQHREFRFCRLPRDLGTFDPLQYLGWRQLGNLLWRAWRFNWLRAPAPGLSMPGLRLTPGLAHARYRSVSRRHRGQARVGRGLDQAVVIADHSIKVRAEDAGGSQVDRI